MSHVAGGDWLLEITVRASMLALLAILATIVLRRQPASLKRQVWAATIVGLLLLPLLMAMVPSIKAPVLPPPRTANSPPLHKFELPPPFWANPPPADAIKSDFRFQIASARESQQATPSAASSWPALTTCVLAIYVTGLSLSLGKLIRARVKAHRLCAAATEAPSLWRRAKEIDVRETEQLQLPITVGALWPVVLVPAEGRAWSSQWRQATLAHEVAHLAARDPLLQLLSELCVVIYWFHPLVHIAVKQLRCERELAADDAVLAAGIEGVEYAAFLYELACLPHNPPATGALVPMLTPAGLKSRVVRVLQQNCRRSRSAFARVAVSACGLIALLPSALAMPTTLPGQGVGLGLGAVIGKVVTEGTGRPVAGATVSFRFDRWPPVSTEVLTDSNGMFQYPWNQPLEEHFGVYVRHGNRAARKVILGVPFGTALPVDMALHTASTLSGLVTTDDGRPVANAAVSVWFEGDAFGPGEQAVATSNEQGQWHMAAMLYGEYRLLVTSPWGVKATAFVVVGNGDVDHIDIKVPRQWPVTGWLQDEAGNPLGHLRFTSGTFFVHNAGLPAAAPNGAPLGERHIEWDETGEDGSFSLLPIGQSLPISGEMPDGTKYFGVLNKFDSPADKHVRSGVVTTAYPEPRVTTLSRGRRLSGFVGRRDGSPVSKAIVSVASPRPSEIATTDEAGTFWLNDVPPGDVVLMAAEPLPTAPYVKSRGHLALKILPMDFKGVKIYVDSVP